MTRLLRACALGFPAALISALVCTTVHAAISYVDATDGAAGNTGLPPSAGGGVWTTNTTDSVDGIWRLRATFGLAPTATGIPTGTISTTSGTVYESTGNSSPSDAVPRLVTTVSGLASATYNVYAYFCSDQSSSPWRIRAGLTDSAGDTTHPPRRITSAPGTMESATRPFQSPQHSR